MKEGVRKWPRGSGYGGSWATNVSHMQDQPYKVDIRYEIGLELVEINVEGSIKSERSSDRRYNLGDETVKVSEARRGNSKLGLADIVNSLVVHLSHRQTRSGTLI